MLKKHKTLPETITELQNVLTKDHLGNRMFYTAKNNIISMITFEVDKYFYKNNLIVRSYWKEASNSKPSIHLDLKVKNKNFYAPYFNLEREVNCRNNTIGELFYSLKNVTNSHYSRYKKPAELIQLENIMANSDIKDIVDLLINKVNYPFDTTISKEDNKRESNSFNNEIDKIVNMFNISKKYSIYSLAEFIKDYFSEHNINVYIDISQFLNGNDIITISTENSSYVSINFKKTKLENVPEKFNNEIYLSVNINEINISKPNLAKNKEFFNLISNNSFILKLEEVLTCLNFPFINKSHSSF